MNTAMQLEECPLELNAEHRAAFERDGYLAFQDVLTPQETGAARDALQELVQRLARKPRAQNGPFWVLPGSRFAIQFEGGYVPDSADPELELKVRKFMWFVQEHDDLKYLANRHPRISAVLEGLLGPSALLYQDMALVKPPYVGSEKPWHQDNAYFSVAPLEAVCGVWIALDDSTAANGCMHVLPGGHRGGALKHIHDRDCEIPLSKIPADRVQAMEIPAGGALFFSSMLPHQTPPNHSPQRRRALQYHYRGADSVILPREEYDAVYREYDGMHSEGIPASCANGWKG